MMSLAMRLSVLRVQALEAFVLQFDELAADFDLRRAAGRKNQIADVRRWT